MDAKYFLVSGGRYEVTPLVSSLPHVRFFQYYCLPCAVQLMTFFALSFWDLVRILPFLQAGHISGAHCH